MDHRCTEFHDGDEDRWSENVRWTLREISQSFLDRMKFFLAPARLKIVIKEDMRWQIKSFVLLGA